MSLKTKALVAAAMFTAVGGLSTTMGMLPANAATPQCGPHCIQIFSSKFGTNAHPRFVETVFHGIAQAGVPTIVHRVSDSNSAGDFIVPAAGPVSTFYAEGMVSAAVNRHYRHETAVQIEYAPTGQATGLCAAVATTAYQNEGLSLQPCNSPGIAVWIIDTADSPGTGSTSFPIVNGSTTDFAHPFAMIIHGDPADECFPQIKVQHLMGNPSDVPANQLWGDNVLN